MMKQISDIGSLSTRFSVKYLSIFVALIVMLISCAHQPLRDSGTVTDKIIEAYGGRERLSKIMAVTAEGRVTELMGHDEGSYRRTFQRDKKLVVDIMLSRSLEKRILDGTKSFSGRGGQLAEAVGPFYLSMVYEYNELNLPFGLLDNTLTLTELRRDVLNGVDVRVFRCMDREGNAMDVIVSADNYRIVKCTRTFTIINVISTRFDTEFSDFRSIGGVLFPFKIDKFARGNKVSEILISGYVINPSIDDALFKP